MSLIKTLNDVGFETRLNSWMSEAKNKTDLWAERIEHRLGIVKGTYKPYKLRTKISFSHTGQ